MVCQQSCFGDPLYLLNEQEPLDLFVKHLVVGEPLKYFLADLIDSNCNN